MTSQLNVDTIVDKAGSGGTNVKIGNTSTYVSEGGSATQEYCARHLKAWFLVNHEMDATLMILLNQVSTTDNGTGYTIITFTKPF